MSLSSPMAVATQAQTTEGGFTISGKGLVTGLAVTATVKKSAPGSGIVFEVAPDTYIPARLEAIADADRGVTLGHPSGQFLSIVEHFLCAAALSGCTDLSVKVEGAPELPLLDGSAVEWLKAISTHLKHSITKVLPDIELTEALSYRHNENVRIYAVPSTHFQLTYSVDFPHPELQEVHEHWDALVDTPESLAEARTFGFVRELPELQKRGLAKGVDETNTLGLTDEGGYTAPLRMAREPVRHKMLDFIGDLMLMGINPLRIKAHFYVFNAGHASHTAFAKRLKPLLSLPNA